jgi:2-polyprenyl-3-methyl-5-hydroxy-6-metoxy-1,4-benzoquinol methylase
VASNFTAHNIRLDDGSLTKPEQPWQMEHVPLLRFTKQFLRMLFPDGFAGKRVVDLGCLEGGYTVELARAGFDALGIEVRQSNFENCQRVKAGTNLPNLTFACDDVHNLAKYGVFDVIFCCGLLYHLDEPRKFVDLMAQVCRRVVIIDTHVAETRRNGKFRLSWVTENEGWAGRWYPEGNSDRWRYEAKWSAWSNRKSFWPMKRDLMQGLQQAGFTMVLECPIFDPDRELAHRVTIVGVKD